MNSPSPLALFSTPGNRIPRLFKLGLTLGLSALFTGAAAGAPYAFTTLAGEPLVSGSADGTGNVARFNLPTGVATDSSGTVYVADQYNHTIRKITSGGVVTTLAGTAGSLGSADGTGSAARFNFPIGVAVDGSGNVYVADRVNQTIRKITSGGVVTTLAGTAGAAGSADGTGSAARFNFPIGVAVDGSGNVYVADRANHTIRKITSGGVVTTLAGTAGAVGSADGTGSAARFDFPTGLAADSAGNLYVADQFNDTIRKITSGGVVTTLAGTAGTPGSADGTGSAARFDAPTGLAADNSGNVYVADRENHTIRKISSGGVVTTLGGTAGVAGANDGTGSAAGFFYPFAVAVDSVGNLYVADTIGQTIRWGALTPPLFTSATMASGTVGQSFAYLVIFSGALTDYRVSGLPAGLTLDPTTDLISGIPTALGTYSVALGATNGAGTGAATLALTITASNNNGAPSITTQPVNQTVTVGGSATFTVAATGTPAPTYQWQQNGVNIPGATNRSYTIASTVSAHNGSYQVVVSNASGLATSAAAVLTVVTANGNAVWYGATNFPVSSTAATVINFSYTVTNLGTKAWGANHYLGLMREDGSLVELASLDATAVGGSKTVIFSLPTPASAVTYRYWVRPLENGVEWFDSPVTLTLNVTEPAVSEQGNAVAYGAHNFALSAAAGSVVNFIYTVANAGMKAWEANHYLALMQSDFTVMQMAGLNATAVGGSKTVSLSLPVPGTPGTYQYRVQALENGVEWFGTPVTLTLTVTLAVITAQGNAVAYGTSSFPLTASAGSVVNFTCNASNLGMKAWRGDHYLALMNADYSVIQLGSLEATAVGGSKAVSLSLPVPATPGTYHYRVQPLENGVQWFGHPLTLTLIVTPVVVTGQGNALAYGTSSFPLTASAGSVVNFTCNVSNLGTKGWGTTHHLALLDAGFNLIEFSDLNGIAIGGGTTARFSFPVPANPGTYTYIVRPLEDGVEWFGTQLSLTLIVTPAVVSAQGNALAYGTTTFPASVSAGSVVNFTYNTTNIGTKAWGSNHYLALLNPDYTLVDFGDLNPTAASGTKAASLNFTAPLTPGKYNYILRPLENAVEWFGTEVHLTLTVF